MIAKWTEYEKFTGLIAKRLGVDQASIRFERGVANHRTGETSTRPPEPPEFVYVSGDQTPYLLSEFVALDNVAGTLTWRS